MANDAIVAQEITTQRVRQPVTALRAIIGRYPGDLKLGAGLVPSLPEPNVAEYWVERALKENLNVRIAEANFEIAKLEVDRARAGHYPTVDLVGSYTAQGANAAVSSSVASDSRTGIIGIQINVPIYQGGFTESRVREAIALREKSRQDLEAARRVALFAAQTGFAGVTSATASVKAFEQAVVSAESALSSNIVGREVGVRTFLDVLNVQAERLLDAPRSRRCLLQVPDRHPPPQGLRRALSGQDIEDLNRQLKGDPLADRVLPRGERRIEARREPRHQAVRGAAMRGVKLERRIVHRQPARRILEQCGDGRDERVGIGGFDRGPGGQCLFGGVSEIEHVRPHDGGSPQADRLDQVCPPAGRDCRRRTQCPPPQSTLPSHPSSRRTTSVSAVTSALSLRRAGIARSRSSSATAANRCGWRGTITVERACRKVAPRARRESSPPRRREWRRRRVRRAFRRSGP
jgi:hypothetical protein